MLIIKKETIYLTSREFDLNRFRIILENANDMISILNHNYKYEYANEKPHIRILGYKVDELIGKPAWSLMHPYDITEFIEKLKEKEGYDEITHEFRVKHKKGHWVWIQCKGKIFKTTEKEEKVLLISRDITDYKKAEGELKKSEEKYRLISENAKDMFVVFNKKNRIEFVNEKPLFEILGYTPAESFLKKPIKFVHPDDREDFLKQVIRNLRNGKGLIRTRLKHKNGHYIWIEAVESIYNDENQNLKILAIMRDITDKILLEDKLKESEEKYRKAYDQLNFYKDLFIHDISNIFQNIKFSVELSSQNLISRHEENELKEFLKIIREQVLKGSKLITNIYNLTDPNVNKQPLYLVEVCKLLKKSIDFIERSFQASNIKIEVDSPFNEVKLHANDLLLDVFDNILINAIKYNDKSVVEILVKLSRVQKEEINYLKMEFIDNGIGISNDRKKEIFQRMHRNGIYTKGMGFGLSLVKRLITSYNGQIWVENKIKGDYSKGSNFILLIPEVL